MSQKDNILPQMFDVKPVDHAGDVDMEKIQSIEKTLFLREEKRKEKTAGVELKMSTERLVEERRVFLDEKALEMGVVNPVTRKAPRQKQRPLRESDFKVRAIQFNRTWTKKHQEIPHLIKSEYVPNESIVPYADVVRRGELPERRCQVAKRRTSRIKFEHSLESVLKQEERPNKKTPSNFRTETINISVSKTPKETHLEHKVDPEAAKKFEMFFGGKQELTETQKAQEKEKERAVIKMAKCEVREAAPQEGTVASIKKENVSKKKQEKAAKSFFSQKKKEKKIIVTKQRKKTQQRQKKNVFSIFSNYREMAKEVGGLCGAVTRPAFSFALAGVMSVVLLVGVMFVSYGFQVKDDVQVKGQQALNFLAQAQEALKRQDFVSAKASFTSAGEQFQQAEKQLDELGGGILDIFSSLPLLSKVSSGKNLVSAGDELVLAAGEVSEIAALFSNLENPFEKNDEKAQSMVDLFLKTNDHISKARVYLESANENIEKVKVEDLPTEYQDKFVKIKNGLPLMVTMIDKFEQNSEIYLELLGHNGPRKYLFLFQNNHEMRATGGFIGSYGLLNIKNGEIESLLIDGIFNPDGQLYENIVPPRPIQKISAGWSTHDANWYPHFPTSAHKIAWFYEKTGGPTVDGIITLTPTVMKKMLEVTGEIEMSDYDTSVNAENFVEKIQFEVEIDYDKEENRPKKFIADLAPKILNELFSVRDPQSVAQVFEVMGDALEERHILIYSFDERVQATVSDQGWSGEILNTERDYLMVVNSNINGFKTDGVIDETITHRTQITHDGSIIDTVKVKRTHNGGDTDFEWWNSVNSDYMRVYVPLGSELISAKGHTREVIEPPLDYEKLKFEVHSDVLAQEESMSIHEETGTRIYNEENKTVFANWVYVSPKETVEVEYQYLLPFKIDLRKNSEGIDTYSLLAQKQSGSEGSEFVSIIEFEPKMEAVWKYPEAVEISEKEIKFSKDLVADQFVGIVFQKKKE
ncbi:MAG: DUF4012 domain-containing protein [Patescibacteria group bacterium]|nr:DUF4012 domain-containing protein [Patescibacteria group bacterium]